MPSRQDGTSYDSVVKYEDKENFNEEMNRQIFLKKNVLQTRSEGQQFDFSLILAQSLSIIFLDNIIGLLESTKSWLLDQASFQNWVLFPKWYSTLVPFVFVNKFFLCYCSVFFRQVQLHLVKMVVETISIFAWYDITDKLLYTYIFI